MISGMVQVELPREVADFLAKNMEEGIKQGASLLQPLGPQELTPPQLFDIRQMMLKFQIIKSATEKALR